MFIPFVAICADNFIDCVKAAQRAWHQAVRRAALKSSAAHVVQDAKLARRTLKAQAAANQAEVSSHAGCRNCI